MPFESDNRFPNRTFVADTVTYDEGLRRHMIGVYNNMMLGLLVTGLVAFFTAQSQTMMYYVYATPLRWVVFLAPFVFILLMARGGGIANLNVITMTGQGNARFSANTLRLIFFAFSATMGLSLASIFLVYKQQSIAEVFFITAGMFGGMSLYGYTTKRSLTGLGSFLFMGLWGIIIATIINMFLESSSLQFALSILCVLIFTGFTAYDTQRIRNAYSEGYGVESNAKLAVMGALSLYLDFLNLFLAMLRLFGNRR